MPRASSRPLDQKLLSELQENFAYLISSLSSSQDIQHFFQTFLTQEEKIMLTKRLMLHLLLENGYESGQIASLLGMSRETVYKHKIVWSHGDGVYKAIITKIANKKKTKIFWKKIETFMRPLELSLQAKSSMKARAKLITGDYR